MVNPQEVLRVFEKEFKKMSYEEREKYLASVGFSYGVPKRPRIERTPRNASMRMSRNRMRLKAESVNKPTIKCGRQKVHLLK